MLTLKEELYFENIVNNIKNKLNVKIPIIPYDHDLLEGKHKNALGCAYSYDKLNVFQITIDEYFIKECFPGNDVFKVATETLEEILCHEIAHCKYFRHGKKHTNLTNMYMLQIK